MESENKNKEYIFNILLMGQDNVGKYEIIRKYSYEEDTLYTIGISFAYKYVILKSGIKIKLKLIDTKGQEKYRFLSEKHFRNADAVLFVFSLDNLYSFYIIQKWLENFVVYKNKLVKYLVGNYNSSENIVKDELIENLTKEVNLKYKLINSISGDGIDDLFQEISKCFMKKIKI